MNLSQPIRCLHGHEVSPYLDDMARLRTSVFRSWPYLYESNFTFERDYLSMYSNTPESIVVLAIDNSRVLGASTALPLKYSGYDNFFNQQNIPSEQVFYFGESMLLPEFRGLGIGNVFFDKREEYMKKLGRFRWSAFCCIERVSEDPRRPSNYRSHEAFWKKRGYFPHENLTMNLTWREPNKGDVQHTLRFWLRDWGRSQLG